MSEVHRGVTLIVDPSALRHSQLAIEASATMGVEEMSVATVTVRGPVTGGSAGAVNHAFSIHRIRLAAPVGLGRPHAIRVRLGRPGRTRVPVKAAGRLSVATDRLATGVRRTFCKRVCGQHYACQYYQSLHDRQLNLGTRCWPVSQTGCIGY